MTTKNRSKTLAQGSTKSLDPRATTAVEPLVPGWALGETAREHRLSERERKLTAGIYAQLPGVVEHVRQNGRLPRAMKAAGGADIGLRILVQRRGVDIELSEDERLVFDAIAASGEVPAGCAVLLDLAGLR